MKLPKLLIRLLFDMNKGPKHADVLAWPDYWRGYWDGSKALRMLASANVPEPGPFMAKDQREYLNGYSMGERDSKRAQFGRFTT